MYKKSSLSARRLTAHTARADNDIVVPEGVDITSIALPTKVHTGDLRFQAAPLPSLRIRIADTRLNSKTSNSGVVQPRLDRTVSAKMVLKASPGVGGESGGSCDTLGREVG
jgi:hypothetical protein